MTDKQVEFRDTMESILSKYVPNTIALYRISDYIFQVALDILQDSDVKSIREQTPEITEVEKGDFYRALRDSSIFTSQKIMLKALSDAHKKVKDMVEMVQSAPIQVSKENMSSVTYFASNEAEFDIDLSSIPKVDTSSLKSEVEQRVKADKEQRAQRSLSSDFDFDNMDLSTVNQGKPKTTKYSEELRVSALTADVYEEVPKVEVDLDY